MANTITIVDNNSSIKITNGTEIRNIFKAQIVEVSVIKTNIIKIDIGQGALHNIFIPFAEVSSPATGNAAALRDAISAMLDPGEADGGGGFSTDGLSTSAKQDTGNTALATINNSINSQLSALNATEGDSNGQLNALNFGVIDTNTKLQALNSAVAALQSIISLLNDKWFYEPIRIDDSGAGVVYRGYAISEDVNEEQQVWAIQRELTDRGVHIISWADGNKNFDNSWMNREALMYK